MTEDVRKLQVYSGHAREKYRRSTQEGLAMELPIEIDGNLDPEPAGPACLATTPDRRSCRGSGQRSDSARHATIGSQRPVLLVSRTAARSGASGSTRPSISARVRLLHRTLQFAPMSPSAGILMSQKSIGSPPPWETRPAGAFDDLRQMPPPKQFQRYCQGYFTPVSGRMNHHLFHRMSLPSFFCLSCDIYS